MDTDRLRRVATALIVGAVAVGAVAAAPGDGPEIVDGCGTDSHVLGDNVDHPRSEGTDIDTIDLAGLYVDEDGEPVLEGVSVTFAMCGGLQDVATGEVIRTVWSVDPAARGVITCDRMEAWVQVSRSVADDGLAAEYLEYCIDDEITAGRASSTSEERLRIILPAEALTVDGTTYTVAVRNRDLTGSAAPYLVGEVIASPRGAGVPFIVNAYVPAEPTGAPGSGAAVSLIDRTDRGRDHVIGSDAPA